jgi:hypothetical protein
MFRGLINDAKAAAGSLVGKYLVRASVAVPFIVAIGFGVASVTLLLVERFGAINAYLMVAGGFTVVGFIAALAVTVKEKEVEVADSQAAAGDTSSVATDAAAQAAVQAPLALLGALFATPAGPAALAGGVRMLGRNIPLVVLVALLGLLFWPTEPAAEAADGDDAEADFRGGIPNVAQPSVPNGLHREAA